MAESEHRAGIKITGDARSAVDAHRQVADEQKKLAEQTQRTNAAARSAAEESRRFAEQQKEQAKAIAASRHELDVYTGGLGKMTQGTASATAAKTALVGVLSRVSGLLAGGVVGALVTAATAFFSFGHAAEDAGTAAEEGAKRAARAWQTAAEAQRAELAELRRVQLEIATLNAQAAATDIGFGYTPGQGRAISEAEARRDAILARMQHGTPPGSGPVTMEEATRGVRTASTALAELRRQLEMLERAYSADVGRVSANVLLTEGERAEELARLGRLRAEAEAEYRRRFASTIKSLEGPSAAEAKRAEEEQRRAQADAIRLGYQDALAAVAADQEIERLAEQAAEVARKAQAEAILAGYRDALAAAEADQEIERRARAARDAEGKVQDERIRAELEGRRSIDEESKRSAQAFETAVATGIMTGFRRGGGSLATSLRQVIENAIWTATLTPVATRLAAPFSQFGQALAGQGGPWVNSAGNWVATSRFGQSMGWSSFSEDAAGNVSLAPTSSFQSGWASSIPFIGAAVAALSVGANPDTRGQLDVLGPYGEKLFGRSYNQSLNPVGSWMRGQISRGDMMTAMIAPGIIRARGNTRRSGWFGGSLGAPALGDNRWFDGATAEGASAFAAQLAGQEQNLMRNLSLTPEQLARVNAGLGMREYDFGMERTPWEESQAMQQIQADRLNAISQALGRSIEDLTRIMSMSTEQWQAALKQMEEAVQASRDTLAGAVRGLPGQLGISSLEDYQRVLAMSEANGPLDRLAAARGFYGATLERARGGDLSAVQDFAGRAQSLLGIGRDVYASGGGYQDLVSEVNTALNELLAQQRSVQAEILKDVPLTIMEASRDQIAELKRGFASMVAKLGEVEAELRRWRNVA